MAIVSKTRTERYRRESAYKSIIAEANNKHLRRTKENSPLNEIKEMRKRFPDSAIERDLIDLGLERLLVFLG